MTEALLGLCLIVGLIAAVAAGVTAVATRPLRHRLDWLEAEARRLDNELRVVQRSLHAPPATGVATAAGAIGEFLLPPAPPQPAAPPPAAPVVAYASTLPAEAVPRTPPIARRVAAEAPAKPPISPEERLGQWLGWLAAVTIVLTVGFFLKWTYDMGWLARIPTWAYIGSGWLGGLALLGAGERFRVRLPLYAQGLVGAGIAILYLTTYAGHSYDVLSAGTASIGLILVGGLALWLSLRHDSQAIGWIGVVLAYLSPVLTGGKSSGPGGLFVYLTALNGVVLAISVVRRWVPFRTAAFLATCLLYGVGFYGSGSRFADQAIGFVLVNWAIFVAVLAVYPLLRQEATHDSDLALAALNPLAAGTALYSLLQAAYPGWTGGAAVAFAGAYWLLSRAIRMRRLWGLEEEEREREEVEPSPPDYLEQIFFAAAVIFAVIAVPLQAHGRLTTTVWALMGAGLYVSGHRTASRRTRNWAALPLLLAVGRLALVDAGLPASAPLFYNTRGFAFGTVILCLLAVTTVVVREWEDTERGDPSRLNRLVFLAVLIGVLMDVWIHLDLPDRWEPVGWSAVALLALASGWRLRSPEVRATGLLLALPPVLLSAFEPAWESAGYAAAAALPGRLAALTLCLTAAWSYLGPAWTNEEERTAGGTMASGAAALLAMSWTWTEGAPGWLPFSWSLMAAALLLAGLRLQRPPLRALGLLAAAAVTCEVLARELSLAPSHPLLLHSRSVGALCAVCVWSAAAWIYHRWGSETERSVLPVLVLGANLQALGWISLEAVDLGARLAGAQWAQAAAQLGLSASWVLYAAAAIGIGFRRDSLAVRWGGVALLLLAVAKVYLFDLGFLALGYRVLSFLLLALVLLGVSYLYQQRGTGGDGVERIGERGEGRSG